MEAALTGVPILAPHVKKLTVADTRVFAMKLGLAAAVAGGAIVWILTHGWLAALPGQFVLGVMFAHAVELQHQALHGTGFRSPAGNRLAGVLLGLPMLVSYSRYRALHLLHHRYLGTDRDTEFFQYGYQTGLTPRRLLSSAFNVRRWAEAALDMGRAFRPSHRYDQVITGEGSHRRIRAEYRIMLGALAAMAALAVLTGSPLVVSVWLVPLLFAEPVHFAIELPEHVFCDRTSRDVFRNTRSIKGSWFSFWLTNGNNFHVEHHLRMGTPINKLPEVHAAVSDRIEHYSATYWDFYRYVLRAAWKGGKTDGRI